MNEFYQALWKVNVKLEELREAFTRFQRDTDKDREYAKYLGDLELAYGQLVSFVAHDRGLPLPPLALTNEDIMWILDVPGAKRPNDFAQWKKSR